MMLAPPGATITDPPFRVPAGGKNTVRNGESSGPVAPLLNGTLPSSQSLMFWYCVSGPLDSVERAAAPTPDVQIDPHVRATIEIVVAINRVKLRRMQYRPLGRTGLSVSTISFGAWAIGGSWGPVDDTASLAALHAAIDAGVTFIDTADVYGDGRSERLVAQLRKERKESIAVATKAGRRLPAQAADGYTRANLTSWVERSLRRRHTVLEHLSIHAEDVTDLGAGRRGHGPLGVQGGELLPLPALEICVEDEFTLVEALEKHHPHVRHPGRVDGGERHGVRIVRLARFGGVEPIGKQCEGVGPREKVITC